LADTTADVKNIKSEYSKFAGLYKDDYGGIDAAWLLSLTASLVVLFSVMAWFMRKRIDIALKKKLREARLKELGLPLLDGEDGEDLEAKKKTDGKDLEATKKTQKSGKSTKSGKTDKSKKTVKSKKTDKTKASGKSKSKDIDKKKKVTKKKIEGTNTELKELKTKKPKVKKKSGKQASNSIKNRLKKRK